MMHVERDQGIRYMCLQSVWLAVFGAAQYLEAETLQQRRHIMFAVRCSHLRRRPPLPVQLVHVDVPRLVQFACIVYILVFLVNSRPR
jgi:hypothetical protein